MYKKKIRKNNLFNIYFPKIGKTVLELYKVKIIFLDFT